MKYKKLKKKTILRFDPKTILTPPLIKHMLEVINRSVRQYNVKRKWTEKIRY
jgi:hypothetical protein